ncbi:MAG: metalloregulator ArsR/SmtB family transcription factor [Acidimicrobiaceae bacterium]|nr:metalloregulator ArsR/SmtB family transcription factor [Acidimicrobiaceae bacterium]
MEGREVKDRLYEAFAQTAKAVANPHRIEILELIAQGERCVDAIARATGLSLTNTSAHLQVLHRSRLVETKRAGTTVFYRLADDEVVRFVNHLRDLTRARVGEVDRVIKDYFDARDTFEPITREDLLERASNQDVVILDVRPKEEYAQGHIPGAKSIPLASLEDRLEELSRQSLFVAYCRGPYCVLAVQAVERLSAEGYSAIRLEDGMPEWRLAGLPVER